jgi:putative nucleotidyltransferase with HDIG domain
MTGCVNSVEVLDAINQGHIYHFIKKPVDVQEMNLMIRNAIKHYKLVAENKRLIQANQRQDKKMDKLGRALKKRDEKWAKRLKMDKSKIKKTMSKMQKMLGAAIQAMQLMMEIKEPYAAGHQRRVANLAHAIASEMGLTTDQIDGIRMAGAIHDIGKIFEPAEILYKHDRLTDCEFNLIKKHPEYGYDILKQIEFTWPVASIVLQHHERLDGSGYPQGIAGDNILIESRIMAVADVVEAMVSDRHYRAALSIDKALEEVAKHKGTLYDVKVVDACLKLFNEKIFKFN